MYNGQAEQDKFVLNVLKHKQNGFFVEIGSHHPIIINNSYVLEHNYNWKGIMIERTNTWINDYNEHRPNSTVVINDATEIDYKNLFETNNVPTDIDYLQIDLDANNGSTLNVLKKIEREVMNKYKFATVTFEHDIYHTNYLNTRNESRRIFNNKGYTRVFSDINYKGENPFEDWYVHPSLIDVKHVQDIIRKNEKHYKTNVPAEKYFDEVHIGKSINWQDIEY